MKSVPVMARPTVPPTCWNRVRLEVPAPSSSIGTLFWTTRVKMANAGPMPRPVMNISSHRMAMGVSGRMFDIRNRPSASRSMEPRMSAL